MAEIITVKSLKKTFKSYERGQGFLEAVKSLFKRKLVISKALKGINISIKEGEVVGFLGPNGAGKSTTIKIISGIMYPDSGKVNIMGYVPWEERKKYVRNIGVVFGQKSQLFWDLPPIDSFYMHKAVFSLNDSEFDERLEFLSGMLNVKDIMKKPTRQLSLGERMRCEFIIAMLHSPKLVFLDEPTIGLDIFAKETIRKFIKEVNKKEGTTFILTSHDLEDIENLCDRVIIINYGRIVFDGKTGRLRKDKRKYIDVKFYDKINVEKLKKIKGIKVLEVFSDFHIKIEANTSRYSLDEIIKKIRMGKRIEDLEVSNPPITELIRKFYGH